jgi:erythromycin esterase-like protein
MSSTGTARITERLVRDKQFRAVIIEGDWPDTDRINRYVRGDGQDRSPAEALGGYQDFPRWMWRNAGFRDPSATRACSPAQG